MDTKQEEQAMAQVAERLHARFPDFDAETIGGVLAGLRDRFEGSPVRHFLPILIEQEAANRFACVPRQRQPSSS